MLYRSGVERHGWDVDSGEAPDRESGVKYAHCDTFRLCGIRAEEGRAHLGGDMAAGLRTLRVRLVAVLDLDGSLAS